MRTQPPIAIVGGGPAGALAGALLAAGGRDVLLFDEKLAWEKPCGGGLTHKALQQYPFLADAGSESNPVEHCELISPSGQRIRFHMQYPVAIFSRLALNGLLLERARRSGVELHQERNAKNAPLISTDAGRVKVRIIRTDEELMIARSVTRVLNLGTMRET